MCEGGGGGLGVEAQPVCRMCVLLFVFTTKLYTSFPSADRCCFWPPGMGVAASAGRDMS